MKQKYFFILIIITLIQGISSCQTLTKKKEMINIEVLSYNPFQENTYILHSENKDCIIVDAGCLFEEEKQHLKNFIESKDLKPIKLINTHGHLDHSFGNNFIKKTYPTISVEAHKEDVYILDEIISIANQYGFTAEATPKVEKFLEDGDVIKLGNSEIKIFHVPGHSPGSVALYLEKEKAVFVGDVLFKNSIGRTDLSGGDFNTLMNSIKTKLLTLPDDVKVYSGHGAITSIGEERKNNSFLK